LTLIMIARATPADNRFDIGAGQRAHRPLEAGIT